MATLAAYYQSVAALPFFKGNVQQNQMVAARAATPAHESLAFTNALVALSAKLAAVDGTPNKAEYQAFEALFGGQQDAGYMRSLFVKYQSDRSSALQFARQVASMTAGDGALHQELLQRLVRIATADAALNAGEMEYLRAVADALGIERETFRSILGGHMVAATSPYAVLGISSAANDNEIRARYMAQVQKLHPDRYLAAGASAETVALLSEQLAALNAAYHDIRAKRAKKFTKPAGLFGRKTTKGTRAEAA